MKNLKALSKRGLALLVALLMCVTMLPMSAFAAEGDIEQQPGTTVSNPTEQVDSGNDGDGDATTDPSPDPEPNESQGVASIGENQYTTLQEAIDAAESGDTIVLTQNFTATGEETPKFGKWLYELNAKKAPVLTIDLGGNTVDCANQYGWLHVNSGNTSEISLTVKNGTIQNATGCNQGSAIWASQGLALDNVTIKECSSSSYGGAVFVGSSDETTNVTVTDCTFEGNSGESGGALYAAMAHQVDVTNTKFTRNTANGEYGFGGAFYVDHGPSTVTLTGCTFDSNVAPYGGAVSAYDNCMLNVTACEFTDNGGTNTAAGGAINIGGNAAAEHPAYLTISGGTKFTCNMARSGGAVYGSYMYPSTLENVTFNGNAAGNGYGGAAYFYSVSSMTLNNVTAINNSASHYGGGFFLNHAPATITGSTVTGSTSGVGGGLYCTQSPVTISGGTITGNKANNGGGIANYFATLTLADDAAVHNNTASKSGDDIYSSDAGYHETYPASLELCVPVNAKLESDGKDITGWFVDGQEGEGEDGLTNRWSAEGFYKEFDSENSVVALKAAYEPLYTVSFDSAGGSAVAPVTGIKTNGTATKPADPTRENYTFVGWQLDGNTYDFDTPVTGDITLVAQWRQNYTPVTPPSGGGEDPTPPTTRYTVNWEDGDGNIIKTTTITSTDVPKSLYPADPEKEDVSFLGWGEPDIVGNVITIIAEWDEEIDSGDVPLVVAPGLDSENHYAYIIGYGDGTVRPTRNITRAEVATIFYRLMTDDFRAAAWSQTNDFADVNSGDWFNNAVSTSAEAGLLMGYGDGTFQGKRNITRAEFAAIAARFIPNIDVTVESYPDTVGHWAEQEIRIVTEAGWFQGDNGMFRPNDLITRAEAMTVVNRMLNRVPHAEDLLEGEMTTYPDNQPGAWYYAAVQEATNSHDYERGERDGETVETWTNMKANRDWAALEKEWSDAYSGSNGTEVA